MNHFNVDHFRFIRDSRHAFGHRFTVEEKTFEWVWCIFGLACGVLSVLFMASKL